MSDICNVCGLPTDLCMCQTIAKEQQEIVISTERKRFGKLMTFIEGLAQSGIDVAKLAKTLKAKFACGGTITEKKEIWLQGDHRKGIKEVLIAEGFKPESIHIQ